MSPPPVPPPLGGLPLGRRRLRSLLGGLGGRVDLVGQEPAADPGRPRLGREQPAQRLQPAPPRARLVRAGARPEVVRPGTEAKEEKKEVSFYHLARNSPLVSARIVNGS